MKNHFKKIVESLLASTDIKINGQRPWDIQIHEEKLYQRILRHGYLGLGESYMDGWWDAENLDQLFQKLLANHAEEKIKGLAMTFISTRAKLLNIQKKKRAYRIGEKHYDLGNDLFKLMLDKGMNYSCAYWKGAEDLDQAQEAKLDLICRKIGLEPGMKVLDIGCGWGGFAKYAAEKYKAEIVGITVSTEQANLAREVCTNFPVEIRLQDYRSLKEKFNRIISIGMFEHVGYKNYRAFMQVVFDCLHDDGLFLLQTIGNNLETVIGDSWMDKYIFPDSMTPSPTHITRAVERLFIIEDWHNFGADYDRTLMAWYNNFNRNWELISRNRKYDTRFYRMWKYYLLSCAGSSRSRKFQLWQIVFSKKGIPGGYESIR
ncbi:MAG: cyclopropane fatty acyl phospholipid synthase [Candidatus Aminicenantes bacterium]|nr:cyclopropane fatty acyl phospholipid synthase [Candidatus Aminicenantes bacterium]